MICDASGSHWIFKSRRPEFLSGSVFGCTNAKRPSGIVDHPQLDDEDTDEVRTNAKD